MNSHRFMNAGRSVFGSRLLEMSSNNIRRLCCSSKFHYSVKVQQSRLSAINILASSIKDHNSSLSLDGRTALASEMNELSATIEETMIELLRLRDLAVPQSSILSSLQLSELQKLDIMTQNTKITVLRVSPLN